jgi:hypothetical protein
MNLDGKPYTQETQKYHAKSLSALRTRYLRLSDRSTLDTILKQAACYESLQS